MTTAERSAKHRNFPHHTLVDALRVSTVVRENKAGKPMRRLLLADALNIKPSSSNFRNILSSSLKYGLTTGTEKATDITLTELGLRATDPSDDVRAAAMREAAATPAVFGRFYAEYDQNKLTALQMLVKILVSDFAVPETVGRECAELIEQNGREVGLIVNISNSPHVILDADVVASDDKPDADMSLDEAIDVDDGTAHQVLNSRGLD